MSKFKNQANPKKIIFLHLPKTGGTTLNGIINQQYARNRIFNVKGINSKDKFEQLSSTEKEKIKILRGHMAFGIHDFLSEPCTYFTLLREPIERVLSHYYYICNNPDWKEHEIAQSKSIEAYLMKSGEFSDLSNLQTKLLCGTSQVNWSDKNQVLETAKKNLQKKFAAVGITEYFDESLLIFQHVFDWNIPLYVRQNISINRLNKKNSSVKTLKIINQYNSLDIELYKHAKNLFETKLNMLDQELYWEKHLKINQFVNRLYQPFGKVYSFSRSLTLKYLRKL